MVAYILLILIRFSYFTTITEFWKWLLKKAFFFLSSLFWWWDSEKKNTESYVKKKVRYSFQKNIKISLLPCFWAHKYNFINNFIVKFMYEDDVTPSLFLFSDNIYTISKNQISKVLPLCVFVPLKFRQSFEILLLVWILTHHTFWTKCPRCMKFAQTRVLKP